MCVCRERESFWAQSPGPEPQQRGPACITLSAACGLPPLPSPWEWVLVDVSLNVMIVSECSLSLMSQLEHVMNSARTTP